jgi:hypothetical protein
MARQALIILLAWLIPLNHAALAQTENGPTKLVTKVDLVACLEEGDYASMVRAIRDSKDDTLKSLLAAKKCVYWLRGKRLFLNETYKGTGPSAMPGVTGDIVHVYAADDYRTYLAPFPASVGDAEIAKIYEIVRDQAQKRQSGESKHAQNRPAAETPLMSSVDFLVDYNALIGQQVRIGPCKVYNADALSVFCGVHNSVGQKVGNISLSSESMDRTSLRRALMDCAGFKPAKPCDAASVSGIARAGVMGPNLDGAIINWH